MDLTWVLPRLAWVEMTVNGVKVGPDVMRNGHLEQVQIPDAADRT